MKQHLEIDKNTNVAFLDVAEAAENAKIRIIDVSDRIGLRSQLLARVDVENGVLLGLIIEDYKAFRREVVVKYLSLRVERITELLLCAVRSVVSQQSTEDHQLVHT